MVVRQSASRTATVLGRSRDPTESRILSMARVAGVERP